jgi:molecular chaperone GrpE (heat shock protein)
LKKETDDMVKEKDEQIKESEKRIDEMSSDFAKMLKNTLAKMQDRIDFGIQSFEDGGDGTGKPGL